MGSGWAVEVKSMSKPCGYWNDAYTRISAVRDLVRKAGGPRRITFSFIKKHASGLAGYYARKTGQKRKKTGTPVLYWILKDGGYDVAPEECVYGIAGRHVIQSMHGRPLPQDWWAEWLVQAGMPEQKAIFASTWDQKTVRSQKRAAGKRGHII